MSEDYCNVLNKISQLLDWCSMKVKEAAARKMLEGMGLPDANGWSIKKLTTKLNKLPSFLDVAKTLNDQVDKDLLEQITESLNEGNTVSVYADEETDDSPDEKEDDDNPSGAIETPHVKKEKKVKGQKKSKTEENGEVEEKQEKPKKGKKGEKDKNPEKDEKEDKPKKEKKPKVPRKERPKVLGYSATALCHWMGQNKYTFADVRKVLDDNGCKEIADASIKTGLSDCKSDKYAKPADVTPADAKKIKMMVKG